MNASQVTPNRRGVRSREAILDAAERVMAEYGYEAATAAQIVKASGIPVSSLYHYFGSKQGVLLAVMERGAGRFFESVPAPTEPLGTPEEHLSALAVTLEAALTGHPDFLKLVLVMAAQPSSAEDAARAREVVGRVRNEALARLRKQMAVAFGVRSNSRIADRLARFTLATVDGAFVARQADEGSTLNHVLNDLPVALVALRDRLAR